MLAPKAFMCGWAEWAFRASTSAHFSMTMKVSAPYFAWKDGPGSASMAAPYSMQPFSAFTFGTLARNSFSMASRLPGLAVRTAITWIIVIAPLGNAICRRAAWGRQGGGAARRGWGWAGACKRLRA